MNKTEQKVQREELQVVKMVDTLSEQTKELALTLALYLAKVKAKGTDEKLKVMEPEFIKLVNGSVRVVREVAAIIAAAKHQEKMIYEPPSGRLEHDRLEGKLKEVAAQCNQILESLSGARDILA